MDFDEFVNAYLGKATDYDGTYGVQCVDLIKQYADSVFGVKGDHDQNQKHRVICAAKGRHHGVERQRGRRCRPCGHLHRRGHYELLLFV